MEPKKAKHYADGVESAAKELAAEIQEAHGPMWAHRLEFGKLLIGLSSAILAGAITFSGSFLNPTTGLARYPMILILSWVMFLFAIGFSLVTWWRHMDLLSFMPRLVNSGPQIREELSALDTKSESHVQEIMSIVAKYSDQSLEPLGSADRSMSRTSKLSFVSFCLGLALFIVFGALQLNKKPNPPLNSDPTATVHSPHCSCGFPVSPQQSAGGRAG